MSLPTGGFWYWSKAFSHNLELLPTHWVRISRSVNFLLFLSPDPLYLWVSPLFQNELGGAVRPAGRCKQTLHQSGKDLALCPLHLPHHHPGPGSRERLGRRAVRLHLQHSTARLQECLLRPLLSCVPHPSVVPSADLCVHAGSAGGHARGLQETWR